VNETDKGQNSKYISHSMVLQRHVLVMQDAYFLPLLVGDRNFSPSVLFLIYAHFDFWYE
jgi:hypothetical protein